MYTQKQIETFWKHVEINSLDACWNWLRKKTRDGYGCVRIGGVIKSAHRVAFEIANGSINSKLFIMHTCDNRACCNPAHLKQGTRSENMQDMIRKGRQGKPHPVRKLNYFDAAAIRAGFKNGKSKRQLSREFGVSCIHIRDIVKGIYWKKVHSPTDKSGGGGGKTPSRDAFCIDKEQKTQ